VTPAQLLRTFDVDGLVTDLAVCDEYAWLKRNTAGWACLPLRSRGGSMDDFTPGYNDSAPFEDTELLQRCPHFRDVIAAFTSYRVSSVRVSVLEPGGGIAPHRDDRLPWRIHVPIVTSPQAVLRIEDLHYSWRPGEAWLADFNQLHSAWNTSTQRRVHLLLVVDPPSS
jgi:quercetin dioxygenase-like cupin family protein